jgi:hypothetical protein
MFESRCAKLEIGAKEQDIMLALNSRMSELPSFVSTNPGLAEDIMSKIIKSASGMYVPRHPVIRYARRLALRANIFSGFCLLSSIWTP